MTDESLLTAALAIPDPAARAAYLDRACAGNPTLRQEVEQLLAAHAASNPLDRPLRELSATGAYDETGPTASVGERIGPYKLLERIGEGGMGEVWVADQLEPIKRRVALKLIKPGMDSRSVLGRFEAERQALAVMDHPNIARVLDAGTTPDGRPYFVMELVKGTPITQFCDARKLTPRERLELFVPVCQAIQHAHQKGIIHRDIKPSNVLVALHDEKPIPKVIDFGVAKAVGQQLTEKTIYTGFGALVGTPAYMAPEQATFNQLDIDTRSDVYSLGVLLYELLAGSPPIEKERLKRAALDEVLRLVREEEPPRPSHRLSTSQSKATIAAVRQTEPDKLSKLMRGELDWIVMKALEKDRARRYETANGFAMDVQRYLSGEPVQAVPPSAGYRLRKFVRKNRGPVVAAGVVLVALMAGIVGTTLGLIEARRQEGIVRMEAEAKEVARQAEAEERGKAEAAKAAALAKEEEARAVLAFFQDRVLAAGRPEAEEGGLGKDVTLRKALDVARAEVGPTFKDRPVVEASILRVLGDTYWYLGERDSTLPMFERALDLRTKHLGADHPDTLMSMNDLAVVYSFTGRFERGLALFERTIELRRSRLGPDHPDTLQSMEVCAEALRLAGRFAEAVALQEEVLALRRKTLGPDHLASHVSTANLALAYLDAGRWQEALPLLEDESTQYRKRYPADHPEALKLMNNLAIAYGLAGRFADELAMYEQILTLNRARYGPDHPNTLCVAYNLAGSYRAVGRMAEGLALAEDTFARANTTLGADKPDTLRVREGLAWAYRDAGRLDAAIALFEENVKLSRGTLGPDNVFTLRYAESLGTTYDLRGDLARAEALWLEILPLTKKSLGADHPDVASRLSMLGVTYLKRKKFVEAEPVLRECVAIRAKKLPDDWRYFNAQSQLGGSLLGQKRYAEAEPLLLQGYDGLKQREAKIQAMYKFRLPEALDRLIELYTVTDKPDQMKKYREERVKYPSAPEVAPPPRDRK